MENGRVKVLIAEDDPAFRRVISFSLERAGFQTEAVSDGQFALERLTESNFDYLVTDHQMPRLSGIDLIQRVRETLPQHIALPIVLCTAKGLELDSHDLKLRYGLKCLLPKPFSPRQLVAVLAQDVAQSTLKPHLSISTDPLVQDASR